MKNIMLTTLASAAALGLAACGSEDVENTPIDDVDELVDNDVNEVGYPVAGELNPEQQTTFDTMDRQAMSDEYDINYDAIRTERVANADLGAGSMDGADASSGTSSGSMESDSMDASAMASANGSGTMTMPPRSEMDFDWLDRNDDGQLSVAEYAIWSLPTNPTEPAPNDAKKPYLTSEQINEAGENFFYFDQDGSTYLSPSEFAMARNSAMTPS